jgi:hypothetical protein
MADKKQMNEELLIEHGIEPNLNVEWRDSDLSKKGRKQIDQGKSTTNTINKPFRYIRGYEGT